MASNRSIFSCSTHRNLFIAAFVWALFQFILPAPAPITKAGMGVVGVFVATLWLWCTEGSGWPSLLCVGMMGTTGICKVSDLFAKTWGSEMVPFVVACFLLNAIMAETGLTRRIALWFITRPSCSGNPWRIMFMFFFSILIVCLFSTSSPIVILYMALAEEIFRMTDYQKGEDLVKATMIGILFVAQGTMFITPVSHILIPMIFEYIKDDFNIIVSYAAYTKMMLPAGIAFFAVFWLIFRYWMKPDVSKLSKLDIAALRRSVPKMSRQEVIVAIVYGLVIVVWLCPDLFTAIGMKALGTYMKSLGTAVPALAAAGLLCAIHVDGKPLIDMGKAVKSVTWNSVFMMAAVMGTAYLFGLKNCGVTTWMMNSLKPILGGMPAFLFVLCVTIFIIVMTNFLSNTLTVSMYAVIIPIALSVAGVNPIVLALLIAGAGNIALSTPSCCPAGGLASGGGWVPVGYQMKYGWSLAASSILLLACIAYPIGCIIFPY
jgi:sodium-dependent dicarboxylate transporter 2/3/5